MTIENTDEYLATIAALKNLPALPAAVTIEQTVQDLATIAALKKILAVAEADKKAELQNALTRGTVYAFDANGVQLGYASVPKPSQPKPSVILDVAVVLPWAMDEFGESVATYTMSDQGRTSVTEYVLAQHKLAGSPAEWSGLPGVSVRVPEPRPATPRFTAEKNVVELVTGMVQRGELNISSVLELGEAS